MSKRLAGRELPKYHIAGLLWVRQLEPHRASHWRDSLRIILQPSTGFGGGARHGTVAQKPSGVRLLEYSA